MDKLNDLFLGRKVGEVIDGLTFDIEFNDAFRLAVTTGMLVETGMSEYTVVRLP